MTFARKPYIRQPVSAPVPLARPVNAPRVTGVVAAVPKREYVRSPALLAAVRKLPCQHCTWPVGVEASHSNSGADGKGRGIKADDNRIAALCHDCHTAVDQSNKLSQDERLAMWNAAHVKTVSALLAAGQWPVNVPIPDLRSFDA